MTDQNLAMTDPNIADHCRPGNTEPAGKRRKLSSKNANIAEIAEPTVDPENPLMEIVNNEKQNKPLKNEWPAFHWAFTWNNHPRNWKEFFEDRKDLIMKIVAEEEVGKCGTPHIQGWLRLFKKNIARTYLHLPIQIHWGVMYRNATERQNTTYCTKDKSKWLAWGVDLPWKREIQDPQPWMDEVKKILDLPIEYKDEYRAIYWIYEKDGNTGKSTFQQHIFTTMKDVCCVEGKAHDCKHWVSEYVKKHGNTPRIVFINQARSDQEFTSYGAIEKVKDMFFMSGKFEGGMVCGPRPHVVIFANEYPKIEKLSNDRWRIAYIEDGNLVWETKARPSLPPSPHGSESPPGDSSPPAGGPRLLDDSGLLVF